MSNATPSKPAHLVVVPFEAWGHVRPLLYLTVQLLIVHPNLHITHLLSPTVAPRAKAELSSSNFAHIRELADSTAETKSIIDRLQLVEVRVNSPTSENGATSAPGQDDPDLVKDMAAKAAAYAEAIAGYFTALLGTNGDEAVAGLEDNQFKEIKPSCVIYDMFQAFVPAVVHQVTTANAEGGNGRPVPVFAFLPSGPTAIIHHYAKEEDGGFLEAMQRIVDEGVAQDKDPLEVVAPLGFGDRGVMKSLPGLPTMTDYELHPGVGACPLPPPIMLGLLKTYETAWSPHLTGFVATNVEDMELEAKQWVEEKMGKSFLSLGFQYSDKVWAGDIAPPSADDADGVKTIAFLDKMLESRGPKSVIYISFGSAFFPIVRPDIVAHLLDTLLATSTPFVFAYATELFPIPEDLLHKVQDAPFGLAVHVAPQVQVLHHAATGFFVSHCGGNSMAEAIVAGVPIVGMPFCADQGEHNEILKKYKAGTDLKQTKCFFGEGEKPKVLYDGTELVGTEEAIKAEMVDLWAGLKGDLGKQLYEGMADLRKLCEKSCSEGGRSRQAMLNFAKYF